MTVMKEGFPYFAISYLLVFLGAYWISVNPCRNECMKANAQYLLFL